MGVGISIIAILILVDVFTFIQSLTLGSFNGFVFMVLITIAAIWGFILLMIEKHEQDPEGFNQDLICASISVAGGVALGSMIAGKIHEDYEKQTDRLSRMWHGKVFDTVADMEEYKEKEREKERERMRQTTKKYHQPRGIR